MANLNIMVILCLVRFTVCEDRISVETVGTITATAGYSIADSNSPTIKSLTSSIEFSGDHDSTKDTSASSEVYSSLTPGLRGPQSLSLRSRQARGKPPGQTSWSAEEKDLTSYPLTDHRTNEQLYSVKPQTFDGQSSQLTDVKSNESVEKTVPSITYGKKMHINDGHDDRPVFNNWSEEVHMSFDNSKPNRSRRKNKLQLDSEQEKRKTQNKKLTGDSINDNKDGWQELSPNLEMATGIITSVQEHDSSQESSGSSESFNSHHPDLFHMDSISSIEDTAHQVEPQNFNHKQVLSKMNHFDFSNAVSQANKTPPSREKRLNYLQPGGGGPPAARYPYSGGGPLQQSSLQAVAPSAQPHATAAAAAVKSVKVEQPSATPNYHSIVVPIPISHQMYASIGGDPTSPVHGQQLASSTVQQAMMSLPVVHNVFFKTDENGGGKTMPAIVIPLKPEYLQHLQQQHYAHMQQQQQPSASDDSLNAAGHQRPVHQGATALQFQQLHQQQQQQQQQSPPSPSLTSSPYAQKSKPAKVKKPFGLMKDNNDLQHRVKQPFGLQHQFYNNPFTGGGGGGGNHVQVHHAGHQQQHGVGGHQHPQHGHPLQQQQHDGADDSRYAQTAPAPASAPVHAFPTVGHPIVVKRPHAYGYASPAAPASVNKYPQAVNKSPSLHHLQHNHHHNNLHHHHQQQQLQLQQPTTEELATAIAQQQLMQQPYKATTYHPGFAYLNGPDDDYPYKPIYKDVNKRNDVLVVRTADGRK